MNLVDDPWIPVRDTAGGRALVGLADALGRAGEWSGLDCPDALEGRALGRLLLSVVYRVVHAPGAGTSWERLAGRGLPVDGLLSYLRRWRGRFDLGRFLQYEVSSASRSGAGPVMDRLVLVDQDTRALPASLDGAAAARALLKRLLWDPSGIRTGLVGDPMSARGRSMPIGPAYLAAVPTVLVQGPTLEDTLVLNLPDPAPGAGREETPAWEDDPGRPRGSYEPGQVGAGRLLVWPSRRMRLEAGPGGRVVGALLANGDRLPVGGPHLAGVEQHALWRTGESGTGPRPAWAATAPWTALLDQGGPRPVGVARLLARPDLVPDRVVVTALVPLLGSHAARIEDVATRQVVVAAAGLRDRLDALEVLDDAVARLAGLLARARARATTPVRLGDADPARALRRRAQAADAERDHLAPTVQAWLAGADLDAAALEAWATDLVARVAAPGPALGRGLPPVDLAAAARRTWRATAATLGPALDGTPPAGVP